MGRAFHRQRVGVFVVVVVVCFASLKNAWRTRAHTAHTISNRESITYLHVGIYKPTNQPNILYVDNLIFCRLYWGSTNLRRFVCSNDPLGACYGAHEGYDHFLGNMCTKYQILQVHINGIVSIVNIFPTVHYK